MIEYLTDQSNDIIFNSPMGQKSIEKLRVDSCFVSNILRIKCYCKRSMVQEKQMFPLSTPPFYRVEFSFSKMFFCSEI